MQVDLGGRTKVLAYTPIRPLLDSLQPGQK
jgi:hypothetical protein